MNHVTRRQILGSAFATAASFISALPSLAAPRSSEETKSKVEKVVQPYNTAEAYKVYSALLTEKWIQTDPKLRRLVILEKAIPIEICAEGYGEESLRSAIVNYTELIKSNWILQPLFDIKRSYALVPQKTLSEFFRVDAGAHTLSSAYPDSEGRYFVFSPVGFDQTKTTAVVHMGYVCGSLCGQGQLYVLHIEGNKWRLPLDDWKRHLCFWVA